MLPDTALAGPTTTDVATTPESAMIFPVVPEREAIFPETLAPAFDTILSAVREYVGPETELFK